MKDVVGSSPRNASNTQAKAFASIPRTSFLDRCKFRRLRRTCPVSRVKAFQEQISASSAITMRGTAILQHGNN